MKEDLKIFFKYLGIAFLFVYSIINVILLVMNAITAKVIEASGRIETVANEAIKFIEDNKCKEVYTSYLRDSLNYPVDSGKEILFCSIVISIIIAMIVYIIKDKKKKTLKTIVLIVCAASLACFLVYSLTHTNSLILDSILGCIEVVSNT